MSFIVILDNLVFSTLIKGQGEAEPDGSIY
jgi:hypothetical protein